MRINYKNTALNLLEKWDDNEEINIPTGHIPMTKQEERSFGRSVIDGLIKSADLFKHNIQVVSEPFMEAYNKGKHKLADIFDKEEVSESGTLIWSFGSWTHTTFYSIQTNGIGDNWRCEYLIIQFSKHSKNDFKGIDVVVSETDKERKEFIWEGHFKNGFDSTHYMSFLISFLLFKKYVELETKLLPPNKKEKHVGIKYLNETKYKVEILDSTWFTTIVKSEGFEVSGHFRFQPCGKNLSERKLTWIRAFEKSGYTRKAKMLNQ